MPYEFDGMQKAYSLLNVKDAREGALGLTIKGMASTPTADRVGDVMDPMGARFTVPMPLLWQHNHEQPVGHVTFAKPQRDGIPFEAFLPYVKEAGRLKDRIDEAIHSLKYRLVGAVSIGFKAAKGGAEMIKDGGVRFKEWNWLELSLVTIPANAEATIQTVKSLDSPHSALSGKSRFAVNLFPSPAGETSINRGHMPSFQDSLCAAEKKRDDLANSHKAALEQVLAKGTTFGADEQDQQTKNLDEIEKLDEYIDFLKRSEATLTKARPARQNVVSDDVGDTARRSEATHITVDQNKPKGFALAQVMRCMYLSGGIPYIAADIAKSMYRDDPRVEMTIKATVAAGSTVAGSWGAAFAPVAGGAFTEFLDWLRPQTIIGRIPGVRTVGFNQLVATATSGGTGYWVGEGKGKPLTSMTGSSTSLPPTKVANIIAVTETWLKHATANNDQMIRDTLTGSLQQRLDVDFIDPAKAVAAGVSPASITNGVTPVTSSGNDEADVRADFQALMAQFIAANNTPQSGVWIMPSTVALALSMMVNSLGNASFPGITMSGGSFFGMPVVVSDSVPVVSAGAIVILVNASQILIADEGGFDIAVSREASLEMSDAPTQSSVATVTATSLVSMFQTNSVAFRAEREIGWMRARPTSVAYISAVNYGE